MQINDFCKKGFGQLSPFALQAKAAAIFFFSCICPSSGSERSLTAVRKISWENASQDLYYTHPHFSRPDAALLSGAILHTWGKARGMRSFIFVRPRKRGKREDGKKGRGRKAFRPRAIIPTKLKAGGSDMTRLCRLGRD